MITEFLPERIDYDGSQLSGLFGYKTIRAIDDSLIAFIGAADVREELVDLEDKLNNDFIKAELMLHFILIIHGNDLWRARLWQLLLVQKAFDAVKFLCKDTNINFEKSGDDIYVVTYQDGKQENKLSVSIAAISISGKEVVHLALNVSDRGAPVKTYSLNKLGIDPVELGSKILKDFLNEYESSRGAIYKVKGIE